MKRSRNGRSKAELGTAQTAATPQLHRRFGGTEAEVVRLLQRAVLHRGASQSTRRQEENANAGENLWQLVQEVTSPRPVKEDLFAWPRLAERQRKALADNVQAFVKGNRRR